METRLEILNQTINLTMKYGIKSVSMDDIAKNIGISKKTIYQHFENKRGLISEMIKMMLDKDESEVRFIISHSKDALDEIITMARHFIQFLRTMSPSMVYDLKKYYAKEWRVIESHHNNFIYNIVRENIKRGIKEGLYKKGLNADVIAKIHVKQSDCITDEEVFPLQQYNKSDLYKTLITYHIRGIVSDKGRKIIDKTKID